MTQVWHELDWWLGLNTANVAPGQMILRALIVYLVALALVRLGATRFLGKNTAFDIILGIILGSVISRGINGSAPFFSTLAASVALVGIHWVFAVLAFRSHRFGRLVKGSNHELYKSELLLWEQMRRHHITEHDLMEAVRLQAKQDSLDGIAAIRLERSGNISVIQAPREPQIIEITVADGVQTVRLHLE